MAFSYVALPGEPVVVAAPDHAVELGGHLHESAGEAGKVLRTGLTSK